MVGADHLREIGNKIVNPVAASRIPTADAAWVLSPAPRFSLLSRQPQKLGVGGQYLAHGVLKLSPSLDPFAHLVDPLFGNVLDLLFSLDHEGERPDGVALIMDAMTGGLATAQVRERERAGKKIFGDMEAADQFEFALTKSRGLRAVGLAVHLIVIIL
ncbi:MAG: hypothetical protein AUG83_00275 [Acidobacteria bacterium 13_1_20CM_4_57_11]|nr:MAG: hypothetical protein AUG83_00275 [Acidobacteria bacterium 13_1_20CM_4_57_11]